MQNKGGGIIGPRRRLTIVGSVVMAAIVLSGCLGDGGMSSVVTWKGTYHVGDFIEYYLNETVSELDELVLAHSILNETITEVSEEWYTVHSIKVCSDYPSRSTDWDLMYPINASWAFNKAYDFTGRLSDMTQFRYVGDYAIVTRWGELLCQYFTCIDTSLWPYDCWVRNGVIVKMEFSGGGYPISYMLKDTNLTEITGLK